ncbi:amino acid permease [Mangrovactinospora gilvigrisea]|uniref:Amino acid permease n=1 Tax=Mangrovactinospora gilvigrisea TaxID=1428644 RepID=A0A1J7BJD8_9ACTN|nr:APC family permease [Mangrovactinospora gilvigrisea]OIV38799.1 amino acid permease [Mangrovactinospora gilvigrisea]
MSTAPPQTPASESEPGFRRTLTFRDLMVYGIVFIGPMAPVGIFGVLDAKSGGAVVLVYLIATVAMGLTAFSYTQMVRVVPRAGSVFSYARAGLGEGPGFMAGWMVMLDYVLIPAVAYTFTGIALNSLVPSVSRWVWAALALVVTTLLNMLGVRIAARVSFLVVAFEVVVLAIFVVAAVVWLAQHGAARPWDSPLHGTSGFALGAVMGAVSVAVLSYLGFDAIASFAEEHEGPSARVGRALLVCLLVTAALFVVQTWLGSMLTTETPAQLAAHPADQGSIFYTSVDHTIGHWMQVLMTLAKALGASFSALTAQAAAGRLLFAMARRRRLPRMLGHLDAQAGVPRRTLLLSAVITCAAAIWAATRDDGLDQLSSVVNVGALCGFTLLHASVVGWYAVRKRGGDAAVRPLQHVVVPVIGAAVTVWIIVEANRAAQWVGLAWLVLGLIVLGVQTARAGSRRDGNVGADQ